MFTLVDNDMFMLKPFGGVYTDEPQKQMNKADNNLTTI